MAFLIYICIYLKALIFQHLRPVFRQRNNHYEFTTPAPKVKSTNAYMANISKIKIWYDEFN